MFLAGSRLILSQERGTGKPEGPVLMDVHGAGAQRSDPKSGNPVDYPQGHGPQGDVIRIYNYVRAVRSVSDTSYSYPVVDTGQTTYFNNYRSISAPSEGNKFYGQDAAYSGLQPKYKDNGDGTITDKATGLMWLKNDSGRDMNWQDALEWAEELEAGDYYDWRLPDAKEI